MCNEEEKRCPLCAEEMDWTDQQFKPCKCGYQVCVWCWHQIMDLAKKEETEGRCPACRTVYEKDKIVAMQANCERDVTKISKKSKPTKAKPKTIEVVTKDLTDVRVIQRKMAYIIGLPLSLADENLLQQKEYFGQYGKISKISLSRAAGGTIQQFVNETCSVYVTYSKEEEAIRCIQSVHGFVLEGRVLRSSFGTAKYCHAWLKNIPCNNNACLYLHTIAPEEDSFGKDEVAAVHTRNRVQQIVGSTDNVSRRCGSILPPPVDISSNGDTTHGNVGPTNPSSSFVDIVQRPSSSSLDKDIIVKSKDEISLDFSNIKLYDNDNHLPSSKDFSDDVLREPNDIDNLSGPSVLLHERNRSSSNISSDQNWVHSFEEEISLPLLNESSNELKFQSSAKSDRIYRNSNVFSTEEIVEHLRRIGDNSLLTTNDEEMSSFDAVESIIISNILSMGFDNSSDGRDELASLNSYNSGKSVFSFAKDDGFDLSNNNPTQVSNTCSIGKDYLGNLEHYLSNNPLYQVPRSPSMAPPGFSLPFREVPPGFSSFEKCPSGMTFPLLPLVPGNNVINGEVDFYDPAILLSCGKGKPTNNGPENTVFTTTPPVFNNHHHPSSFEDETKLRLLLLQQLQSLSHHNHNQDSIYSANYLQQQTLPMLTHPPVPPTHTSYNPPQTYDPSTLMMWKNDACNERLVLDKYISGYGDLYNRGVNMM